MKSVKRLSWALVVFVGCANPPPPASEVAVAPAKPTPTTIATVAPTAEPAAPTPTTESDGPSSPMSSCGLVATVSKKADGNGFALTLKNNGTKAVKLVTAGDGSEAGWRTPALAWTATQNGKPAKELEGGRCGMMNEIEKNEVFTIAPGASHTITCGFTGRRSPRAPTRCGSSTRTIRRSSRAKAT